jgi:uncharacterized Rmd1/YagE family protein
MKKTDTQQLQQHIGQLFSESLKVSSPVQMLHLIREKMNARGYRSFDREDILQELGRLQHLMGKVNSEMLRIHDLLKQP